MQTHVTYPRPRQVHPVLLPRLHKRVCLRRWHVLVRLKLFPHVLCRQRQKQVQKPSDRRGGQSNSGQYPADNGLPPSCRSSREGVVAACRKGFLDSSAGETYTVAQGTLRGGQYRRVDTQQRAIQVQHIPAARPEDLGGGSSGGRRQRGRGDRHRSRGRAKGGRGGSVLQAHRQEARTGWGRGRDVVITIGWWPSSRNFVCRQSTRRSSNTWRFAPPPASTQRLETPDGRRRRKTQRNTLSGKLLVCFYCT